MKQLLVIGCLKLLVCGCSPIHKCNSNNAMEQANKVNLLLTEAESAYLNKIFETTRKDFDFTNKNVGFVKISGEYGKTPYFDMHKKHSINANSPCDNGTLYIFNVAQKAESGGYDAAIVYWSKMLLPIEKVIKRLKNKEKHD